MTIGVVGRPGGRPRPGLDLESKALWPVDRSVFRGHIQRVNSLDRSIGPQARACACRHNTVKQLLSNGIISSDFVSSKHNLADLFTKGLSGERINCTSRGIGLKA